MYDSSQSLERDIGCDYHPESIMIKDNNCKSLFQTISRMSTPLAPTHTPKLPLTSRTQESGRRSKQARGRVRQMKKMYGMLSSSPTVSISSTTIFILHWESDEMIIECKMKELHQNCVNKVNYNHKGNAD